MVYRYCRKCRSMWRYFRRKRVCYILPCFVLFACIYVFGNLKDENIGMKTQDSVIKENKEILPKSGQTIKLKNLPVDYKAIHPDIHECQPRRPPVWARIQETEQTGQYQKVEDREIFVFSAYYDNRTDKTVIRILGISAEGQEDVYCQMIYKSSRWISVKANVSIFSLMLPEMHQGFKYRPYFITCSVSEGDVPVYIGVSPQPCVKPINLLIVQVPYQEENVKLPKILVCMKTVFGSLIPQRLVEFIEWQKLLQADHIILYDTNNITPEMNRTVNHYVASRFLEIKKYKPPVGSQDVRDRGQLVQFNDCLYRNMYKYQYITFLDPDEIIFPRLHDVHSYPELIDTLLLLNSSAAGYRFPNIIYCLRPNEENRVPPDLLAIRKLVRTDVFPYGTWTKVIVNPTRIVEMGIHRIEKAISGYNFPVFVPPSVGALHHYRPYDLRYCHFKDRITLRFEREMLKRYKDKIMLLSLK